MRSFAAALLLVTASFALADTPVRVHVAQPSPVTAGHSPQFSVRVDNASQVPVKIIAAARNASLQRWSYEPFIRRNGEEIFLLRSCDLPVPPTDGDYAELEVGGTYEFALANFSGTFGQLEPGRYSVRLRYRHYRYGEESYTAESNDVVLDVVP